MTARRSTLDRARDDLTAAVKRRERDKARADRTAGEAKAAADALAATDREVEALRGYVGALEPKQPEAKSADVRGPVAAERAADHA